MEGDTEFWTSHVEACRREGSAVSVYARRYGLTLASLYYWRRKLKLAAAVNDAAGRSGGQVRRTACNGRGSGRTNEPVHTGTALGSASGVGGAAVGDVAAGVRPSPRGSAPMHPGCRIDQVFLCRKPVDFRKSIGGLSVLVEQERGLDPFASALYVFVNRDRNTIKVLYWWVLPVAQAP